MIGHGFNAFGSILGANYSRSAAMQNAQRQSALASFNQMGAMRSSQSFGSALYSYGESPFGGLANTYAPHKTVLFSRDAQRVRRGRWRKMWRTAAVITVRWSRGSTIVLPMVLSEAREFNAYALGLAWAIAALIV